MPAWTTRDERQFENIRDSLVEQGRDEDRAEEIAARTVNKRRRKEGRTANKTTQGTGNPNHPLEQRTVEELRNIAGRMNIPGRSKMNKAELVGAIRSRRGQS